MGHALPRRIAAALAGAALSTAMLAACGGGEEASPPSDEPVTEEAPAEDGENGEDTADSDRGGATEPDDSDDATEDNATEDSDSDDGSGDATGGDTNLFEGIWGFGHDSKVLSAEELGDLVEERAEELGPEEMSLDVQCESGIDTGAGQSEADCTAFADEGVEHAWHITAGPADAGLEVQVENVG